MRREVWANAIGWDEMDEEEIVIGGAGNRVVSHLSSGGQMLKSLEPHGTGVQYPPVPTEAVHRLLLWPVGVSILGLDSMHIILLVPIAGGRGLLSLRQPSDIDPRRARDSPLRS